MIAAKKLFRHCMLVVTTRAVTTAALMLFTAVPPSPNPSSKLNRDLQQCLTDRLHVDLHAIQKGRLRFSPTQQTPPYSQWPATLAQSSVSVHSIRWVVAEITSLTASNDNATTIAAKMQEQLSNNISKQDILQVYNSFGNAMMDEDTTTTTTTTTTPAAVFDLSCRRWACSVLPKSTLSTLQLSHELRRVVAQRYQWAPYYRNLHQDKIDLEFQVVLHGHACLLELVLLVVPESRRSAHSNLPRPGCKRVEAWALVQSAALQPGNVVLDPLCGKATFLVEAATTSNDDDDDDSSSSLSGRCRYIGVDTSPTQLAHARENVKETGLTNIIQLHQGDARALHFIPNDSVDVIMTCPPFGRQFTVEHDNSSNNNNNNNLAHFYQDCLMEWMRVLATGGRLAVLIDVDNAESMMHAMQATGLLRILVHREPFRLGRLQATVIVAVKWNEMMLTDSRGAAPCEEPSTVLPWEGDAPLTRAGWNRLRAASLPCLKPYRSSLPKMPTL